jgi:hypothetical protein
MVSLIRSSQVIAAVVMRATARAVCLAFTAAMAEYGIPGEVLADSGKQFTGLAHDHREDRAAAASRCRRRTRA